MVKVCGYCKSEYGVKCPACGSPVEPPLPYFDIYQCGACLLCFDKEAGGETNGVCPPCMALPTEEKERLAAKRHAEIAAHRAGVAA